jgi:hypothetical protein
MNKVRHRKDGRYEYSTTINGKRKSFYGKTEEEAIEKYQKYIVQNKDLCEVSLLTDVTGIRINHQSYEYRKTIDGNQISFFATDINSILTIKNYVDNKIDKLNISQPKTEQNGKYIYFISNKKYCKIGTAVNIQRRLSSLQVASPEPLEVIYSFYTTDGDNIESKLHELFKPYHIYGEWFDILFLFNKQNNEKDKERVS